MNSAPSIRKALVGDFLALHLPRLAFRKKYPQIKAVGNPNTKVIL
jgi:hypothetical protein